MRLAEAVKEKLPDLIVGGKYYYRQKRNGRFGIPRTPDQVVTLHKLYEAYPNHCKVRLSNGILLLVSPRSLESL